MSEQQQPEQDNLEQDIYVDIVDEQEEKFSFSVEDLLNKAITAAAQHEGFTGAEVSVSLVDDERIQELNRDYRGKDQPTDVLSFALEEETEDDDAPEIFFDEEDEVEDVTMLGDIIISVPTAKRQAAEYGHSLERELAFLAVHGFLHLIGYDHMTEADEKEMFSRQDTILEGAGFTRG